MRGCFLLLCLAALPAVAQQVPARLTLEEAVRIARDRNPAYRRALNDRRAASSAVRAGWAAFLPTLDASLSFNGSWSERVTGEDDFGQPVELPNPISFRSSSASQSVGASVTVFDGLRSVNELRAARADARAADAGESAQASQIIADVSRLFYAAIRTRRLIDVEEQLLESAREQLAATERLFRVAAAQQVEVLGARVEVATREQSLDRARGDARKSVLELKEQLGIIEDVQFEVVGDFPTVFDPAVLNAEQLIQTTFQLSPQVRQAEAQGMAAGARAAAARSNRWPSVRADASFGRTVSLSSYDALFDLNPRNKGFGFGLSVSVPIFDGFETSQQVAQADAVRRNAEESAREARLNIDRQVRSALIDLQSAYRAVQLADRSVQLSRERLELSREQYQQGALGFTDLQQTLQQAAGAERDAVGARAEFATAVVTLEALAGRVLRP